MYKSEIDAARTTEQKEALAKKLTQSGIESKTAVDRFVLLKFALDYAAQSGNLKTATTAADEISKSFDVDPISIRTDLYERAAKALKKASDFAALAVELGDFIDRDEFASPSASRRRAAELVMTWARRSSEAAVTIKAGQRLNDLAEAEAAHADAQKAEAVLRTSPDDPAANLIAGRYYCFIEGNWEKGLPLLAKSGDPLLKAVAIEKEPSDKLGIADHWWEVGEKEKGRSQANIRAYAATLYQQVLPELGGLQKVKVQNRLSQVAADSAQRFAQRSKGIPTQVQVASDMLRAVRGAWLLDGPTWTTAPHEWSELIVQLPRGSRRLDQVEFTFSVMMNNSDWGARVRVELADGRAAEVPFAGKRHGAKSMDDFLAGQIPAEPSYVAPNKKYKFRCVVSGDKLSAYVNDKMYHSAPLTPSKADKNGEAPLIRFNFSWQLALIQDFALKTTLGSSTRR